MILRWFFGFILVIIGLFLALLSSGCILLFISFEQQGAGFPTIDGLGFIILILTPPLLLGLVFVFLGVKLFIPPKNNTDE